MAEVTATDVIFAAKSQIGTKEYPKNSNCIKYNTEYYGKKVSGAAYPWCCVFVWWIFRHLNASYLFYNGKKTASCSTLYNYYKGIGQVVTDPKPGDLVFFKFSKTNIQHIGICVSATQYTITTIDGNTGDGDEANGGAVMERTRKRTTVYGFVRPKYKESFDSKEKAEDYSLVFDPAFYADNNPDVKSAFGTNTNLLLDHFLKYGMKEGRCACSGFSVAKYMSRYKDLRDAYGVNLEKYYYHYIKYGYKEGRNPL